MALLHWHPMPHQHIIGFFGKIYLKPKINSYLIQLHELGSHGLQDPYFKRRIHGPYFIFINWGRNPMTSSTSIYGLGLSNESKLTVHITSLTLMASSFFNNSPYLHKITTKLEIRHLIFGLWSKLISPFGETLGVVVCRAKKYVQWNFSCLKLIKETYCLACFLELPELWRVRV